MKKRKKSKFFSLLIKNYLLFTVANIVIIVSVFIFGTLMVSKTLDFPYGQPSEQEEILKSGSYDKININNLVGKKGYIQILNDKNQVIYSGGNIEKNETKFYTSRELSLIPIYSYEKNNFNIRKSTFNNNGRKLTLLIKSNVEDTSKHEWFQVLDKNLNVILSSTDENDTSYTKKEIDYLTGNIEDKYNISKYEFTDNEGKNKTLILRTANLDDIEMIGLMGRDLKRILIIFISFYGVSMAIFIIWLNRKVKKPLEKLNKGMISFTENNSHEMIQYKGPYEFVQICDSFNIMVSKLNESEKQREILENEKQKILADISHDLKTPITNIQGYAKALSDGIIPQEEQGKYLDIIYKKSNNLNELINIFYEYSKLEHSDFKLNRQKKDLSEFLRIYIAEEYDYIYAVGFNLEIDIPEEELICNIDEIQLKRAFQNIITNSIKHNKKGTTIGISLQELDNYYKIIICDNGVGIPKDISENIFDAFVVGDESRNTKQGSGLGLAITKKIIEKHNGSIKLVSDNGNEYKTIFEILLPK